MSRVPCSSYGAKLTVYSILADEEVRQGLKVWVSHEHNDIEVMADVW